MTLKRRRMLTRCSWGSDGLTAALRGGPIGQQRGGNSGFFNRKTACRRHRFLLVACRVTLAPYEDRGASGS